MFVRSAINYSVDVESAVNGIWDFGEDMAHQSFKDECDINNILRQFAVTGQLPDNVRVPQYADFEEAFDFKTAMNVIRAAEEAFALMPSDVRDRFANDPARFVDFVNDDANYDEAVKMGLAVKRPVSDPIPDLEPVKADSGTPST